MQFCTEVDIRDVVTRANFGSHRFRRFRMAGGRISGFSIDFHRRPYNTLALCDLHVTEVGSRHGPLVWFLAAFSISR